MSFICLNGRTHKEDENCLDVSNRAFRYGDSFFESIRLVGGVPIFLKQHNQRIERTFKFLGFKKPAEFSIQKLGGMIRDLAIKNHITEGGKARLIIWRKAGGLYGPTSNEVEFLVECHALDHNEFVLNQKGLTIGVFNELRINPAPLSHHKTTNCLPYVLASRWAKANRFDDVLMLDSEGYLAEGSSANLFVYTNGKLVTPDLENGGLKGTMRNTIIELVRQSNLELVEAKLRLEDLESAEEIFLTNASSGIRWVGAYGKKRYYKRVSEQMLQVLNEQALISSGLGLQES
ncbi:MAG: branched-subunit amino acid aminotransferase/4-amino-4-deoxychorismate lyase [Granulosicoccus sp.]